MKNLIKILLLLLLVGITYIDSFSQSAYNIHIGPSFSLTKSGPYSFNYGGEEYISSPGIGVDIGINYSYQWSDKGFGAFASFDFIINGLNNDYKDVANRFSDDFATTLIKFPVYLNLPLSAGLFYRYKASDRFSLYCNPGMTFNFMTMTDYEWEHITIERDWSTSIGYRVVIGILVNESISFYVDYLDLGKHDSVGRSDPPNLTPEEDIDINIQLLTLTAGWSF